MKNKTFKWTIWSIVVIIISIILAIISGVLSFFWDMIKEAK